MLAPIPFCTSFWPCVATFQTIISAIVAGAAALISATVVWKSAKLNVEQTNKKTKEDERRKRCFALRVIGSTLVQLSARAGQAEGTIKVVIGANTEVNDSIRAKTTLSFDSITSEWEYMSLIPPRLLQEFLIVKEIVDDHNFDMARAGGAFGADNFQQSILQRTRKIQNITLQLAANFWGEANRIDGPNEAKGGRHLRKLYLRVRKAFSR